MQLRLRLPQLEALACDRCGGAVELTALSDHFKCGHCGHQQALAGDVRARLEAYHAAVRDQLPTVVRALDDADLFVFRHAAETKLNIVVAAFGVGVLALWCVAPVGMYFSDTHAMTDLFGASCFVVPMLGLPLVALVRFLTRDSTRVVKRYRVQLSDVQARCSGCGGDAVMPGGIAFTTCSYCRAPLVATASKIAGVLDEVRGFRRAAGLRKRATERDTLGPRANAPLAYRGNAKWYADTTAAVYARPTWAPTRAWLHAVAARVGAAPLEGDEVVGWLDAQWPGADPATSSAWSHPLGAVAFDEAGLPARIDVWRTLDGTPAAATHLAILLATEPPGDVGSARESLAARGFELTPSEAGLVARATPETAARLLATSDPIPELAAAVQALGGHARAMGLGPPPAPRALPEPS